MGPQNLSLPSAFEILLHTDNQDQWPLEAILLAAAYHGNVHRLKDREAHGRRWEEVSSMLCRTTYDGMNTLHAATGGKGVLPICRFLVEEAKMDVNKHDTFKGKNMTPLQHAVFSGNLPVVRYLLDHGVDLHQEGSLEGHDGFTALHRAAEKGRCAIEKLLLSRGAYVDGKSCHATPVHLAVLGGHDSTLKILLDNNADPNKEVNLSTPLDIALRTPSLSCLKLLIEAGAEVNGIGDPLAVAAQEGLTEAIKCLLEADANPNTPDLYGRIPIELAAVYGTNEDAEVLFPFTSPIPTVTNWSVDGIINHMKLERKQLQAVRVDRYDAALFSNRSLCWLRTGDGRRALQDAVVCKILRPKWVKAYFRQGQALMLLKDYEQAYDKLSQGLELDPQSDTLDKLYWEAMELKNGSTEAA